VYGARDNLWNPARFGGSPTDVIAGVRAGGLAFDPATHTGVTLLLLGAVMEYGMLGAVASARPHDEATALFAELTAVLG
jgi:hypothetical protein